MLASLPKSYKPLVQTLLVGKGTLNLEEVTAILRENERMMRDENAHDEARVLAIEDFEQGRNQIKKHDSSKRRSRALFLAIYSQEIFGLEARVIFSISLSVVISYSLVGLIH